MNKKNLLLILFLALAVRLAALWYWETNIASGKLVYGDSDTYWHLAQSLTDNHPYQYGPYGHLQRMPGYPLFISGIMNIFGSHMPYWVARCFGVIISVLSVWLVAIIAFGIGGNKAGLMTALGAAVFPEFVLISVMILAEPLFCLFVLAEVWFWLLHERMNMNYVRINTDNHEQKTRLLIQRLLACIGIGTAAGFATLCKPGWIIFTPCALVIILILQMFDMIWTKKLRLILYHTVYWSFFNTLIIITVQFAILTPWAIRNYHLTGDLKWTTTQSGPSLYDGLNPHADGSSNMDFMPDIYKQIKLQNPQANDLEVELLADKLTKASALEWSLENPLRVIQLGWIKYTRTWSPFPNQNRFGNGLIRTCFLCFYLLFGFFCFFGLNQAGHNRLFILLCVLVTGYVGALHCFFVGSIRYRQPVMWVLAPLAGLGLKLVIQLVQNAPQQPQSRLSE